jgi:hypothetical protein
MLKKFFALGLLLAIFLSACGSTPKTSGPQVTVYKSPT